MQLELSAGPPLSCGLLRALRASSERVSAGGERAVTISATARPAGLLLTCAVPALSARLDPLDGAEAIGVADYWQAKEISRVIRVCTAYASPPAPTCPSCST